MASHPSEADIEQMLIMSAISRDEAIRRLKGNNNDLNLALNELFDDPDSTKYRWEEAAFTSDRDGAPNNAGISFQVQGPDDPGAGGFYGAPSRPPSRSSNRSPLGKVISLAAEHAAADPRTVMSQDEIGDLDLQRALAESAEEAGLQPQQYGVTQDSQMVHFGPANRGSYDDSQWAMVLGSSSAQEVLLDPDATDRKREVNAPAFLKPSVDDFRLASILTIYHEIPLAREVLLNRNNILSDYGHDPEWWMGRTIVSRTATLIDDDNTPWGETTPQDFDNFIREIQRLMAFLDKTERSYGSAEALLNMPALKGADAADVELKFFEAWKQACLKSDQSSLVPFIFTEAVQPGLNESSPVLSKYFAMLDLELPSPNSEEEMDTIYDLADQALWSSSGDDVRSSAYLSHLGDVIAFRIGGSSDECKMVRIPATWYPDRYLEGNRQASLDMRKEKAAIMKGIEKICSLEYRLTYFKLASGRIIKVKDLFNATMMPDTNVLSDGFNGADSDPYNTEMISRPISGDNMDLNAELHKVIDSIDKKLKALENEKEKARASLRELSNLYTKPSTEPNQPPIHKYTLRGVSVNKYVIYVCRRAEPDLVDMDLDADRTNEGDQWWKIDYSTSGSQSVNVTKTTQKEVLLAAHRDSKNCTVVYASEKAMAEPQGPLPESLENFVRADNLAFSAEFALNIELADSQVETASSPRSPPKRKFDESSEDSSVDDASHIRWSGMSPPHPPPPYTLGSNVTITQEELPNSLRPPQYGAIAENDMIMGQDPIGSDDEAEESKEGKDRKEMVEMQAKSGMPRLLPSLVDGVGMRTTNGDDDGMDVDNLVSPSLK